LYNSYVLYQDYHSSTTENASEDWFGKVREVDFKQEPYDVCCVIYQSYILLREKVYVHILLQNIDILPTISHFSVEITTFSVLVILCKAVCHLLITTSSCYLTFLPLLLLAVRLSFLLRLYDIQCG